MDEFQFTSSSATTSASARSGSFQPRFVDIESEEPKVEAFASSAPGSIVSLVIENFKSYAGRVEIGPFSSFTCIIGPNGSGKSNTMDAISFVLGVRTAQLRGRQLQDLIHRSAVLGDDQKTDALPQTASVSLVYEKEGDEFAFKREITAHGSSHYHFNDARCSKEEYDTHLAAIGVDVKARNFLVFQGEIESVSQKKGYELTEMIERVSGSLQFAEEFEAKQKQWQEIDNELEAFWEKQRQISKEKRAMKDQKKEAQQWYDAKQSLDRAKVNYCKWQLFQISEDLLALETQAHDFEEEKDDANEMAVAKERAVRSLQAAFQKLQRATKNDSRQLDGLKAAAADARTEESTLTAQCARLEKGVAKNDGECDKRKSKLKKMEEELEKWSERLQTATENMEEVQLNLEAANGDDASDGAANAQVWQRAEVSEAWMKCRQNVVKAIGLENHSALDKLKTSVTMATQSWELLSAELDSLTQRKSATEESRDKLKRELEGAKQKMEELKNEHKLLREHLEERRGKQEEIEEKKAKLNEALCECRRQLQRARVGMQESRANEKQRKVLASLKTSVARLGLHGRVCDLVSPRQKRYELMLAVALGRLFEAVVVEDRAVAIKCIEYCRNAKRGHFTFLPLADLRPDDSQRFRNSLRAMPIGLKRTLAVDCVKFEDRYKKAVDLALASTLVVDTIDEAKVMAQWLRKQQIHGRVVACDGSMILANGNMTGGSTQRDRDLTRRTLQWDERLRAKVDAKKEQLLGELRALDDEEFKLADGDEDDAGDQLSLDEMTDQISSVETDIRKTEASLRGLELSLKEESKTLKIVAKECAECRAKVKEATELKMNAERELSAKNAEHKKVESKELRRFSRATGVQIPEGVDSVQDLERFREDAERKRALALRRANIELEEAKNKVEFLTKQRKALSQEMKGLKKKSKEGSKELKKAERKWKRAESRVGKSEEALEEFESEMEERQNELKQKRNELRKAKRSIDDEKRRCIEAKNNVANAIAQMESLEANATLLIQQSKLDGVDIFETEDGSGDEVASGRRKRKRKAVPKQRNAKRKKRKRGKGHRAKRRKKVGDESSDYYSEDGGDDSEEHGEDEDGGSEFLQRSHQMWEIDFSELKQDETERSERTTAGAQMARKQEFESVIENLEQRLESMAPNLKAGEQYDAVAQRYKDAKREKDAIRERMDEAKGEFETVQTQRCDAFQKAFDHIAAVIGDIYAQLTLRYLQRRDELDTRVYGAAELYLVSSGTQQQNFERDVVYNVRPFGKVFRPMEELSGGEKSVASLALLFAVHSFRQAPFFVLDEVDAALDSVNIRRVANFIQKKAAERTLNTVVISLKDKFYSKADALIGVYKDTHTQSSGVLQLRLSDYADLQK